MNQQTFLKVPFVWEEPKPLIEVSPRLIFEPVKARHDNQLISVVTSVMALSLDASDQKRASEDNPHTAAEMFLNSAREDFSYQNEWWQFGINGNGDIVGLVLPVTFNGCAKEGLEEGTIYYIGVFARISRAWFCKRSFVTRNADITRNWNLASICRYGGR